MQDILTSWFVQGMIKATSDMWLKAGMNVMAVM